MVSQSAAWFAILATKQFPVKTNTVELPGVGAFMAEALNRLMFRQYYSVL